MADPILHIKDSYYFEVPKGFWEAEYAGIKPASESGGASAFPAWMIKLDQSYLDWQAKRLYDRKDSFGIELPEFDALMADYHHWLHEDHANAGKPLGVYIESAGIVDEHLGDAAFASAWEAAKSTGSVDEFRVDEGVSEWSGEKIEGYNDALSGKILIPQPFGTLKNLYEPASGLCITKFMVIEVVVALIMCALFIGLARRVSKSPTVATTGRLGNALEAILAFMRDGVARPTIGAKEGDAYVPLLWSVFFFILLCNLFGMIPGLGAPTSAFGCTLAMAGVILMTGIVMGSKKMGVVGFWLNQIPSMDLPLVLAIVLKPLIWAIEVLGLFIKHAVLAIRLLANMFAGHIVLLGIMGLAFSWEGATSDSWWIAAPCAVLGSTLFSVLEVGVAFLQAYIFTFLSALFIGAAVHHH